VDPGYSYQFLKEDGSVIERLNARAMEPLVDYYQDAGVLRHHALRRDGGTCVWCGRAVRIGREASLERIRRAAGAGA
jgi:hypothetical protein